MKRIAGFKYLSSNKHCTTMLQNAQKSSVSLKYVSQSKPFSAKAKELVSQAFTQHYPPLIYVVCLILSISSTEKLKRRIDSRFVSSKVGRTESVMKCTHYQTAREQYPKQRVSSIDSSMLYLSNKIHKLY